MGVNLLETNKSNLFALRMDHRNETLTSFITTHKKKKKMNIKEVTLLKL